MPIGVPRIIYCWGEELPAQWTDIYNFIFRRRMVFLMQYLDDELCNQICGLLINIHMEDRSKEMEKKEMERSGVFKSSTKPSSSQSTKGVSTTESTSFYNKKSRSMEDLLNADEDLGIDEVDKLEQYTLQKITTEWLNWNAQFFDYSDEPYLYYLAELLSKDFNNGPFAAQTGQKVDENKEISQLLNMLKNKKASNVKNFTNKGNVQMGEVYSPFRTNANFSSIVVPEGTDASLLQGSNDLKQEMLFKHNLFSGKKAAKKQKLLQMFQNYQNLSNSLKQDKSHKNISNLLSNLAQNDFSDKLSSSTHFAESSETMLGQRNLRREFNLENHFSSNFTTQMKSFNYLNSSTFDGNNSQSEFRDYYRKQTERALMDEESKKVFVIINSFGGSVGNGITVHDALQFIKAGSLTLALGVAASAASLALAGGTIGERYVTEGCHVMIHQPECLTAEHKVLTSRGWVPIADVTLEDKVAVLDKTGEMTYQNPLKVHKYDYEGPMYKVKTTGVDLFVTPNHRMYVNTTNSYREQTYDLIEASSIFGKKVRYKNNAIWNKPDYQFVLPAIVKHHHENRLINVPSMEPDMNSWLTFFGLWVSEGHTSKVREKTEENNQQPQRHIVYITQVKKNVQLIIEETLNKLGFHFVRHSKHYEIQNKQLWSYLNPLDKGALNKFLPDWVWLLSSKQCQILLNSLILGDGHVNKNDGKMHYFSGSEQLANDVSRLALHAGAASTIQHETAPSRPNRTVQDQPIQVNNPHFLWRVNIIKSSFYPYANYNRSTVNVFNTLFNNNVLFGQKSQELIKNKANLQTNSIILEKNTENSSTNTAILTRSTSKMCFTPTVLAKGKRFTNSPVAMPLNNEINTELNNNKTDDRYVYYKGPVYCLTVPNNVFYVERNGKPVWTGNSALQGQASDIWIDSQEIMKIRLDVAEIYSLSTYRPRHKILRDLDRDFYLTATETIQYGLADEIATNEVMQSIVELTHQAWDVHDATQERLLDSRARIVGDSAQTQESTG